MVWILFLATVCLAKSPVTLRYAVTDGADSLKILKGVVAEFEAANPDIKIKVEPVVEDLSRKAMAMYAAGVAPDVIRLGPKDYRPLASRGALLPLDDFIRRTPSVKLEEYYPNIVDFFTYEGKIYVLPREVGPTALVYYNERLFDEAGLAYPSPDWTWTYQPRPESGNRDWVFLMSRLTKKDARGRTTQYGFSTAWPQLMFDTLMLSRNLKLWDSNEKPTRLMADDPQVIELMNFASGLVNKQKWVPSQIELSSANTNQRDLFLQGKLAMYQSGPWEILKFRQELKPPNDRWNVVNFPAFEGGVPRTSGEGSGTAIFSTTRYPEQAWRFVAWMSGERGQTVFARAGLNQPAIRRLAMTPGVWLPAVGAVGRDAVPSNIAITDAAAASMAIDLTPEYFRPIAQQAQGIAFDVLSGVRPPEETLKRLQTNGTRDLVNAQRRLETSPYPTEIAWGIGTLLVLGLVAWVYWPERKINYTNQQKKESRSAYWFLLPWIVGLGFTIGPMIYSLFLSFAQSDIIQPPKWVGMRNYSDALMIDDSVPIAIRQTFIFSAISIPLGIGLALALALLLNQPVKGVPLYRALFYLPSLASGVAMSLLWMRVFNPDQGLLNYFLYDSWPCAQLGCGRTLSQWVGMGDDRLNWLGNTQTVIPAFVIMGMWGAGGGTIIFLAGLQGISTSYYEAATLDGASAWKKFRSVTMPLLTPTIFFSLITGVIGALQVFTQAVVMTDGGPDRATLFFMVHLYRTAFQELQMGYASALAWILFVIILIITVVQLRASKRWVYYEGELK